MRRVMIRRHGVWDRRGERGVTMALVALSMVAVISFAALAIDLGALYEAKAEAQRSADAAALTAARVISVSGITGDPTNGPTDGTWATVCGGAGSVATVAAIAVANDNLIGGAKASTVHVYYGTGSGVGTTVTDMSCTGAGTNFGVNPVVSVYVQQASLPNFFSRVFSLVTNGTTSNSGVSATSYAEVFNPSGSGTSSSNGTVPVQPRCVKPWMIPNIEPFGNGSAPGFVSTTGTINNPGVYNMGAGVIGKTFLIGSDCKLGTGNCLPANMWDNPPTWNSGNPQTNVLEYIPALVSGTPTAVPSCAAAGYQSAVAGCDQTSVYSCGTPGGTTADLTENPSGPAGIGDSATATQCLINYGPTAGENDTLVTGSPAAPVFPFLIQAGLGSPVVKAGVGVNSGYYLTTSNSIVTIPIFDTSSGPLNGTQPSVTVVGFLQAFVNGIDQFGNLNITILNVSGCGTAASASPVFGTSPVPIRLIAQPSS